MSFGMRVWNESGALTMDTNTFTYQVLGQWVLDFSGSTAANPVTYVLPIPGFNPATCALVLLPTRAADIPVGLSRPGNGKCYPYVSVSNGQAVIAAKFPQSTNSNAPTCQAVLRAVAIRYA